MAKLYKDFKKDEKEEVSAVESNLSGVASGIDLNTLPSATNTASATMLKGTTEEIEAKATGSFEASENVNNATKEQQDALSGYKDTINKEIVSQDTWDAINSTYKTPTSVTQADKYLKNQLSIIQSGKTSYSDQIKDMMSKIQNREEFSYDADTDPLFQQALASAMNSGKQAMQDTIGQASALTGGYGSTYATSAANQSYNAFIEDAYDNLPQYYQMALEAYQLEGDEMYRQLDMLNTADSKEFDRTLTAYDSTFAWRNQMYNESYSQFRDTKSDAFNSANLQLNIYGQQANDAYNLYNATSDYADTLYSREYDKWYAEMNQAMQWADMLNTDYWNQSNQDFTASENQKDRDHDTAENQAQRDWQTGENQLDRDLTVSENQKDRDHTSSENQLDRDFTATQNQLDRDLTVSENQKDRDFTASENAKNRSSGSGRSGGYSGGGTGSGKTPTQKMMQDALEAYNKGTAAYNQYMNSIPAGYNIGAIQDYVAGYGTLPYSERTYTVVDDGGNNWGWGVDNNAKVRDEYGNEYTLGELAKYDKDIALAMSNKKYTVGTTYKK